MSSADKHRNGQYQVCKFIVEVYNLRTAQSQLLIDLAMDKHPENNIMEIAMFVTFTEPGKEGPYPRRWHEEAYDISFLDFHT